MANKPDTTTYLLRNVPVNVWLRFQAQASLNGLSSRDALIALLSEFGAGRVTLTTKKRALQPPPDDARG